MTPSQTARAVPSLSPSAPSLEGALRAAVGLLFHHQTDQGYWWYTLEANETIGAGILQVLHFLGGPEIQPEIQIDPEMQEGLTRRMLSEQRGNGAWGLFYEGPGDLSTTIECYFAL